MLIALAVDRSRENPDEVSFDPEQLVTHSGRNILVRAPSLPNQHFCDLSGISHQIACQYILVSSLELPNYFKSTYIDTVNEKNVVDSCSWTFPPLPHTTNISYRIDSTKIDKKFIYEMLEDSRDTQTIFLFYLNFWVMIRDRRQRLKDRFEILSQNRGWYSTEGVATFQAATKSGLWHSSCNEWSQHKRDTSLLKKFNASLNDILIKGSRWSHRSRWSEWVISIGRLLKSETRMLHTISRGSSWVIWWRNILSYFFNMALALRTGSVRRLISFCSENWVLDLSQSPEHRQFSINLIVHEPFFGRQILRKNRKVMVWSVLHLDVVWGSISWAIWCCKWS